MTMDDDECVSIDSCLLTVVVVSISKDIAHQVKRVNLELKAKEWLGKKEEYHERRCSPK